ncbi:MAG: ATP-binding cassette domain-containing protein [Vallitaleaceae bacterium]|jgi:osmoprotectant transport system ATP-binding protein|nr:ATP-binding cassette domain-containing protein [Vallitaleaceae bacterium]
MSAIEFRGVTKSYQAGEIVLDDIHLNIEQGVFITIIGPSGCGKTTLIKLINLLINWDSGDILVHNKKIKDWDTIELRRSIGYVIQQTGLFPHMTVGENIAYVLNIMKVPKEERRARALELLAVVQLETDIIDRHPWSLSGGQAQRVGVARALAANPDIILMDEPFGAVDEITRRILQEEILNLHATLKKTIVFVTHDIEEALKLGSIIILMNKGKIEQVGTKIDMIFRPKNQYVEDFFGHKNFSAYLSTTHLYEVVQNASETELEFFRDNGKYVIDESVYILEAIRIMMIHKQDSIGISRDGQIIGIYKMDHLNNGNYALS